MNKTTLKSFKDKALQNQDVVNEYKSLIPKYELKKKLIAMRKKARLTQEKLTIIMEYAKATGHELRVDFI